jgi:hypothetical protein
MTDRRRDGTPTGTTMTRRDPETMTDTDGRRRPDAQTLKHVSHTHPDTDRTFGGNFTFARAGAIVADGGRPDVVPEDGSEPADDEEPAGEDDEEPAGEDDEEPATLADVEHTPPGDSEDANRVFERGGEG